MEETGAAPSNIKTRFVILSDTHGLESLPDSILCQDADVAIHCGDLTTQSEIHEYEASITLLQALKAPLKLVIAGNHDFTMDIPVFQRKVAEAQPALDFQIVEQTFGSYGQARRLFSEDTGITFLDEGTHSFRLQNGASLTVYASPYTPSFGDWGFQYHPDHGHDFSIGNVDVVMTHGPPRGIMDYTHSGERSGCPYLFEAVARARPLLHCFGHIHEAWGAKLVTWRQNINTKPSHLTDIDNERSTLIDRLPAARKEIAQTPMGCSATSHCSGDKHPLKRGSETLFVNAAIEGFPLHPPWVVDLELPPN